MYGRGGRWLVLCVGVLVGVAACSPPNQLQAASENRLESASTPACSARNPIRLLDVIAQRSTGAPRDDVFRFTLAAATQVCVRIANPSVGGHRVTSGWVSLDGAELLAPNDFSQSFEGVALPVALAAGEHSFQVRVASKPGTGVTLQIEVAGPVIDSIAPQYAATGSQLFLAGEGFVGPVTVMAGDVALALPSVGSAGVVWATTVAGMPVGPLTVTTPFGSATSAESFVPAAPRGLVPFYPVNEFELGDGTCSGQAHLLVRQDGTRMGFVVKDTDPNTDVSLDIDDDNDQSTIERTLNASGTGNLVVLSETFAALDLYSHVKLGRLFLRIRSSGACGARMSHWIDLRSVFSPGLVIVRTTSPAAVAARQGLTVVGIEEELVLMKLPVTRRMEDVLVALALDPDSQGALPDNVMYSSTHAPPSQACGVVGGVHELGTTPAPFPQWTLDRIGFTAHPNPASGVGVVVAVLDTGVVPTHPELAGALLPGLDFTILGDGTAADVNPGFHGTGVATVIAARQGNGGMVGVAPGATILPMRVLGRTGAAEGFGLHRAFSAVLAARARGINVQVVNVSMAEFLDTFLLAGGIVAALLDIPILHTVSGPGVVGGLVVRAIIRERVTTLTAAGVAVVAAAGNIPLICPPATPTSCVVGAAIAAAGMQFPASAPGAFAVAASDDTNRVIPSSMRAVPGQAIALSAPSESLLSDGTTTNATPAASSPTGIGCSGGGTSFATPHMSGAIAALLAPPPPLAPMALNGVLAAIRLVENATPMLDPPSAAGAGLLNIASAQLPEYIWSFDFHATSGRISDFGFLPGVGDFALRGLGRTVERIPSPGGDVVPVVTLPASAAWLNTIPSTSRIILGFASTVEVRSSVSGTLILTRPSPSFRAAVSSRSTVLGGELILLGAPGGQVQLVRGGTLFPLTTVSPEVAGETFLDAVWASDAAPSSTEVFAARTATRIEFFRVGTTIGANCQAEPGGCPVRVGSVRLALSVPDGSSVSVAPVDWAAVVESTGPTAYAVDGSSSFFVGRVGTGLTSTFIGPGAYRDIETSAASTKVYAADEANSAFATIQNQLLVDTDDHVAGVPDYNPASALRISPDATYGYLSSGHQFGSGAGAQTRAIFIGGLVP